MAAVYTARARGRRARRTASSSTAARRTAPRHQGHHPRDAVPAAAEHLVAGAPRHPHAEVDLLVPALLGPPPDQPVTAVDPRVGADADQAERSQDQRRQRRRRREPAAGSRRGVTTHERHHGCHHAREQQGDAGRAGGAGDGPSRGPRGLPAPSLSRARRPTHRRTPGTAARCTRRTGRRCPGRTRTGRTPTRPPRATPPRPRRPPARPRVPPSARFATRAAAPVGTPTACTARTRATSGRKAHGLRWSLPGPRGFLASNALSAMPTNHDPSPATAPGCPRDPHHHRDGGPAAREITNEARDARDGRRQPPATRPPPGGSPRRPARRSPMARLAAPRPLRRSGEHRGAAPPAWPSHRAPRRTGRPPPSALSAFFATPRPAPPGHAAARQALATMSSTSCRIRHSRSRAASSPEATIRAGSPGRRGAISGVNSMPVTRRTASMICSDRDARRRCPGCRRAPAARRARAARRRPRARARGPATCT